MSDDLIVEDDVILCIFQPCQECGRKILVLWDENPSLIKVPMSCQEHQTN